VAKRLGFGAAFDSARWRCVSEHAALSAFENEGGRDFDIGALKSLSDEAFEAMAPVHVADALRRCRAAAAVLRRRRFFANATGHALSRRKFPRCAPKPRRAAVAAEHRRIGTNGTHDPQRHQPAARPASAGAVRRGFILTTPSGSLSPMVISARIVTDYGQCILRVVVSERQQRGMLFAPIH